MNKEQIALRIIEIIAENADYEPEEIHLDHTLMNDLSLTSMDLLNMIPEIENVFSVTITEKTMRSFVTVQDIVDFVLANQ